MKITIPESINDITLGAFQKYHELLQREDLQQFDFDKRKIEIFTALKREDISNIKQSDFKFIIDKIDIALEQNVAFEPTFKIKDVEFGFIPNLDEISLGEFSDLDNYFGKWDKMHNVMAVLYRPVIEKNKHNQYLIAPFNNVEEFGNLMKYTPLSVALSSHVFFWNLEKELLQATISYLEKILMKMTKVNKAILVKKLNLANNGDGIRAFMQSQRETLENLMKSSDLNYLPSLTF
mgnify:CR=1 FL=1